MKQIVANNLDELGTANQRGQSMMGLTVLMVAWLASVFTPVLGQIDPTAAEALMTGRSQTVLAVIVLGLSGAIIWTMRRLLASMNERVQEAKANSHQQVEQANRMTEQMTKALSENSTALSHNATTNADLKDAVHCLSRVVDKKLDKAV